MARRSDSAPGSNHTVLSVSKPAAELIPFLIHAATRADAPQILDLARLLDSINLPTEKEDLTALIEQSQRSFGGKIKDRSSGRYLFVMKERGSHRIVGTAMIIAKHGIPESPHFYLEMATDQRYSKTLKKMFRHTYVTLRRCLDGPTEVGGLIVDPAFRRHRAKIGQQLSFVRFLYIAARPDRFEDEVLAEMIPPLTPEKENLFWECYGQRVTGLSFREADKLSIKDKEFIDALFPPIPLYTCMLPDAVQAQLGQVGPETQGAVHLLEKIGLHFLGHVDPFDGGPYYGAKVAQLQLVQRFNRSRVVMNRSKDLGQKAEPAQDLLIGWEGAQGFCAARVHAQFSQSAESTQFAQSAQPATSVLFCSAETLQTLDLQEGMEVCTVPFL